MTDFFKNLPAVDAIRQARRTVTITAADSNLTDVIKGINLSVSGVVRVSGPDDAADVYADLYLTAGQMHGGLEIRRVWATGTDAAVKAGTITGLI